MRKSRNKSGGKFVKLDEWFLKSAAWRSLDPVARCVFIELMRLYNGHNNGELGLSCRRAADLCNVSKNTAADAFHELLDRKLITLTQAAGFGWKAGARKRVSACYALTLFPVGAALATKDFVHWSSDGASGTVIPLRKNAA